MERPIIRWGWIVAAVLGALAVGGWPAAWVRIVAGGLFVAFAVFRVVRGRRR
jgi:putative Ca2+/H+ antiporter (TMEM165/GDT1 family)